MNKNHLEIELLDKIFYVQVVYSKNKNIYFKMRNNNFILITPKHVSEEILIPFVKKGIEKFQNKIENFEETELFSIKKQYLILFGSKYNFSIEKNYDHFLLKIKDLKSFKLKNNDENSITQKIKFLLKFYLDLHLKKSQKDFEKIMEIPEHKISIRYKTSNWASNSVKKLSISYNSKLAHFETKIINYVIVHELVHHLHPNHSKNFWNLVEKYYPNWKQVRNYLNNNKVTLD